MTPGSALAGGITRIPGHRNTRLVSSPGRPGGRRGAAVRGPARGKVGERGAAATSGGQSSNSGRPLLGCCCGCCSAARRPPGRPGLEGCSVQQRGGLDRAAARSAAQRGWLRTKWRRALSAALRCCCCSLLLLLLLVGSRAPNNSSALCSASRGQGSCWSARPGRPGARGLGVEGLPRPGASRGCSV